MTSAMKNKIEQAVFNAFWKVVHAAPKDTGNLAFNAIQLDFEDDKAIIWVNQEIAPYMVYTEEPWVSKRWHGKKNPNEGWFAKVAEVIANEVAQILGGEIEE